MASSSSRRATAADVAHRAQCTPAAVSLWINGKTEGRISAELGERIRSAVAELGYVPNRVAQQLSTGQSRLLAFVFPDVWYTFFSFILDGITSELDETWDYALNMTFPRERATGGSDHLALQRALRAAPAGLIVASPGDDALRCLAPDTPTVVVDSDQAPEGCSLLRYDFQPGIGAAARLLAELGHLTVGYIGFDRNSSSLRTRRQQLAEALNAQGITFAPEDLLLDSVRPSDVFTHIIDWLPSGVTALICGDETLAYGVLEACRTLGFDVPTDISVISFNDLAPASLVNPALTSIRMPAFEMGQLAGRMLAELVSGGEPETKTIPTELVVRESTGPTARQRAGGRG